MRLIRRRTKDPRPQGVLVRIATLLSQCRTASTQAQIGEYAAEALGQLVPFDNFLLLEYPPRSNSAEVLHARGRWSSLSGGRIRLGDSGVSLGPDGSIAETSIRGFLQRSGEMPPHLWCGPLRMQDRVIGSMWVGRGRPDSREFAPGERRMAGIVADIVAGGLHQLRLGRRTEALQIQLQALRTVEQAITSSMDLNVTLNIFLDHAMAQLGVDAASLLLLDATSRELTLLVARGFRNNNRPQSRIRSDRSLAFRASLERKTVYWAETQTAHLPPIDSSWMKEEEFASYSATPLIAHGRVRGVLEVFRRIAAAPDPVWTDLLESLALQAAIAIESAESFQLLERNRSELAMVCDSMIEGLARAVELRAREAEGHSRRVAELSTRLAEKMGLSLNQMPALRRGALLHDIGKIGIPDYILWKSDTLSEEEWQLMRQHPKLAEQVLAPIDFLRPALDIPKFHHERWDGGGYPYGLAGNDIPLPARIFSVVDVWDSMQANRPFRRPRSEREATEYLSQSSGRQFDPEVVRAFLQVLREFEV
jgi:HD-GYP domain-containing protein (c-di-GMP phosphodiesterase class II)